MNMLEEYEGSKLLGEFGTKTELAKEPPINWLIDGWLPGRELTILYGAPGTFKSFLALGWSLELASANMPVVYIAAEGLSGLRPRVEAWCAVRRRGPDIKLPKWSYYNASVWFNNPDHRATWIDALGKWFGQWPILIVVDTLARNFDGDENSAKELGHFIDGVERIRRATDSAILVLHHTTKKDGTTERGNSALRAASFAMLRLDNPRPRPKGGGGSVSVTCSKMKDAELANGGEPMRIEFDAVDLAWTEFGTVYDHSLAMKTWDNVVQANKRTKASNRGGDGGDKAAKRMKNAEIKVLKLAVVNDVRNQDVRGDIDVGSTTAHKLLNSLVTRGFLKQKGAKKWARYSLTARGRAAIE